MTFCLNKNLLFIETMHVMKSGLDKLVKNVSDKDFKYLVEKFGSENLELLKQKDAYVYEYINSFERFNKKKNACQEIFFQFNKKGKVIDDGKTPDGHMGVKDYLTCEKNWDKSEMKNMGDYHNHYFKKRCIIIS